jgi:hypothetical protein
VSSEMRCQHKSVVQSERRRPHVNWSCKVRHFSTRAANAESCTSQDSARVSSANAATTGSADCKRMTVGAVLVVLLSEPVLQSADW